MENNTLEVSKREELSVMPTVVGVRFRACGKIYTFETGDIDVGPGTRVVVDSEMGLSIGYVVTPKHTIERPEEPLKKIIRIASEEDFETLKNNRSLEAEAKVFCIEKAKELDLPMKIVTTEATLDRKRLIFYFTADGRIDFRELVRTLAAKFKTRIEMRQIGVRDEVKMLGGIGACGRQTCCSLFLTSFEPITIRMAKEQDLSINQNKLSGICGRLMCCLSYEYRESTEGAPTLESSDEELITVSDEVSDNDLQSVSSEVICAEELQQTPVCSCSNNIIILPELKPEEIKEVQEEKHLKREQRRKKRKRRAEKKAIEREKHGRPETNQPESKDKGRPFNRRRKFWKKRKH
jgi:cell fate regulator YaaT (PSP1 superfamily)